MEKTIQQLILNRLIHDKRYAQKVLPHLKKRYFHNEDRIVYSIIIDYVNKYRKLPKSTDALSLMLRDSEKLSSSEHATAALEIISDVLKEPIDDIDSEWILDETEKYCQDESVRQAVLSSFDIIEGKHPKLDKGAIPSLMSEALKVSFSNDVGHDYFDDSAKRHEKYREKVDKIEFDIDVLNKITNGGVERKSLNIWLAPTGVGKSLVMCHLSAHYLLKGYNVLYITLEMAEHKIAQRIDANMFDIAINDIPNLSEQAFESRIKGIRSKASGNLIIKEYPTSRGNTNHFEALLDELKMKKNFTPDIVMIDYLNICDSTRLTKASGSYDYVKSIAEEVRGFAVDHNLCVWSATQTNRDGAENSDINLKNTSESFGVPATADFMAALISNDALRGLNQLMIKQLKNRYGTIGYYPKFLLGIEVEKSLLYELEDDQAGLNPEEKQDDTVSQLAKAQKTKKYAGFIT